MIRASMAKPPTPNPFVPFFPGDRATAPMALEEESESAWQRFQELHAAHQQPFAPTEPAQAPTSARSFMTTQPLDRASTLPAKPAPVSRRALTLDQVMVLARRNNRACPMPGAWAQLVTLLPSREQRGSTIAPPPPIDGPAWGAVSPMQKRLRLRDQIEWAEQAGVLAVVHDFLAALAEEQWLHM
jgi:hypothetical protein